MKKKKILKLFIGSNNQGKIKEIRDLLPKTVQILTPKNFNLESPKETGATFKENSLLKAKFFSKKRLSPGLWGRLGEIFFEKFFFR